MVAGSNYLLESGGHKVLVDCGLLQGSHYAERRNFDPFPYDPKEIEAVFITHAHIDHIGGAKKLKDSTGAPLYLNEQDVELYRLMGQQAAFIGIPTPAITSVDAFLREGEEIQCGEIRASVIHTPGHTPGSVCLLVPNGQETRLIAGDTLFRESIGRTDLWGGSYRHILRSLKEKLLALNDDVIVVPGHGPLTTIGHEREFNPFLQAF